MLASVGIVTQLFGVVLLAAFLLVLRRYADVRGYFGPWTWAWVAYAVALGAVAARLFGGAYLAFAAGAALDTVYLLGKLGFFLGLCVGARRFAGRRDHAPTLALAVTVYGALALVEGTTLNSLVAWQAPVAVVSAAVAADLMLGCPPGRRTIGSRTTGMSLAVLTTLWTLYGVSFLAAGGEFHTTPFLRFLASYNSFIDLIVAVVLAFGMAVLVLEEAKRAADAAHADLARAHEVLRKSAVFDALTGALNRRAFREAVAAGELAGAGAVVLVDLDNLKVVNDTCGHAVGDRLLAHVAATIAQGMPDDARLYRWGGDEFVVVVPGCAPSKAARLVGSRLDDAPVVAVDGGSVRVEASLGVASYTSIAELERAVARADASMYADKLRRKGTPIRSLGPVRALG